MADKILIIGGTGYIEKFIVASSAKSGHPTFVLVRDSTVSDPEKSQIIENFKAAGRHFGRYKQSPEFGKCNQGSRCGDTRRWFRAVAGSREDHCCNQRSWKCQGERKIGKTLERVYVPAERVLTSEEHPKTNSEIEPSFGVEASELYPDVKLIHKCG